MKSEGEEEAHWPCLSIQKVVNRICAC